MPAIKCKMCGGDLELLEGVSLAECAYCGTKQTVPAFDSERKLMLFNRAGRLLRACEFDQSAAVFASIAADYPNEPEAYWGLLLCKYGIEYVNDPATNRKVPTCHRSSFDSVLEDADYLDACAYADPIALRQYQAEAKELERIRKGVLEASAGEAPCDIFLCCKETDENGDRTIDSLLAQNVYDVLTDRGYRVFFSRISLENKLGEEYEPCIFAALHSAKIMLVFGTSSSHFHAVWVRNEWSRFLKLMVRDKDRYLIPCYRDMDPYDMPEAFSRLQAQDLGKIGAMQDLIHGIEKLLPRNTGNTESDMQTGPSVDSLLKRGQLFLEDRDWDSADSYFDKVLDIDPENAEAYLGKLLAKHRRYSLQDLKETKNAAFARFTNDRLYQRFLQFSNQEQKAAVSEAFSARRQYHTQRRERENLARVASTAFALAQKCKLRSDGEIVSLGRTQLPDLNGIGEVVSAQCGFHHIAVLRPDQTAAAAGDNQFGQCNVGNWRNIKAIAAGFYHTVGLQSDGTVVATGDARLGRCSVERWKNITAIAAGANHTVGLRADGTVVAVGANGNMQCNTEHWRNIISIAAGGLHTVGLQSDGTVVATGEYRQGQLQVAQWNHMTAIDAGFIHTVGLRKDGTVLTTSSSDYTELAKWKDVSAVCADAYHTVGVRKDRSVVFSGTIGTYSIESSMHFGNLVRNLIEKQARQQDERSANSRKLSLLKLLASGGGVPEDLSAVLGIENAPDHVVALAAGDKHAVYLREDGTVAAYGDNTLQQCAVNSWRGIISVAAGGYHTLGLMADGTVLACGDQSTGACQVDSWNQVISVAAGSAHSVALRADGTVLAAGYSKDGACTVASWTKNTAIAAGAHHTAGLTRDGTVLAVGANSSGQCETGAWRFITAIAAGNAHTVGLRIDGTVAAVGANNCNQCDVETWRDVIAVATGPSHTLGLRRDGKLLETRSFHGSTSIPALFGENEPLVRRMLVEKAQMILRSKSSRSRQEAAVRSKQETERQERLKQLERERDSLVEEYAKLNGILQSRRKREIETRLIIINKEYKLIRNGGKP